MTKCCGEERNTNFCPKCGSLLKVDPLAELIAYCITRIQNQMTWVKKDREWTEKQTREDMKNSGLAAEKRHLKSADKWRARLAALQEAVTIRDTK